MHSTTDTEHVASTLVSALEECWETIRRHHPELPTVVMLLGIGSEGRRPLDGHFAHSRWAFPPVKGRRGKAEPERRAEVMIAGELFERGSAAILEVLLHEAAHALAFVRKIDDRSREGRYHNERFAVLAREVGLECQLGTALGWTRLSVPPGTLMRYAEALAALDAGHVAARQPHRIDGSRQRGMGIAAAERPTPRKPRVAMLCGCPRRIYLTPSEAAAGGIGCKHCRQEFALPKEQARKA